MSRKQFIQSQGATCKNWTWSWSFVNEADKFIIFGAWDVYDDGNMTLIMTEDWEISRKGSRQPGYPQSREHIRLIEEEDYKLKPFLWNTWRQTKRKELQQKSKALLHS